MNLLTGDIRLDDGRWHSCATGYELDLDPQVMGIDHSTLASAVGPARPRRPT